ncbi:MAG: YbhB/YbcL family Raf kinase inhibitor-like protein [Candidatus Eremiobacteraeota bacterium]|nr:YbhB/YbcL family Raf kinase inhibitor-like protein [Candidatus Eremiobacteraeota bacterium]
MRAVVALLGVLLAALNGTMQLRSADFSAGGVIPTRSMAVDCGGENRSPALSWSDAPKGTRSFALIVHDPDAPIAGGFYHWVLYNLPASSTALPAQAKLDAAQLGQTSRGQPGYYGPCPPPGPPHHYNFTLYALDVAHISAQTPTASQLEARFSGHVLARSVLTGIESNH